MSKKLPLNQGRFALIDDEDFERASQFKWFCDTHGCAARNVKKSDGSWGMQTLSRFIMNAPSGVYVDHIHGDRMDNRKSQLRFCTNQQNNCNKGKYKNNKSGFKGVFWSKSLCKWTAQICVNGKRIHLGYFADIIESASAYATAAEEYHGEFART